MTPVQILDALLDELAASIQVLNRSLAAACSPAGDSEPVALFPSGATGTNSKETQ